MERSFSPRATCALAALLACTDSSGDAPAVTTVAIVRTAIAPAPPGPNVEPAAIDYLHTFGGELQLSADDGYRVISIDEHDGLRHIRLQETHAGVPVRGSEIIVHADSSSFLGFNGTVTRGLDGFDVEPTVSAYQALATAHADHGGGDYSGEESRLLIRPGDDGEGAALVWRVAFSTRESEPGGAGRWTYDIGARTGHIIDSFNALETAVQASGAGGNPKRARLWDHELDVVDGGGGQYKMLTDRMLTFDLAQGGDVVAGPIDAMPDPVANDAHGFAEVTLDMLSIWMGRDSIDDRGYAITSRVHDTGYCPGAPRNACWDGLQMTYGDGSADRHAYSGALDCVGHELAHGFTQYHAKLGFDGQAGGLNESFSDVAGTVAEFFREQDDGDFVIFEDITIGSNGVRDMCNPTSDHRSIGDAHDFKKGMDPHLSSGVGNRAFCLAVGRYKARDGGTTTDAVRELGHVWFTANAAYWTSETSFAQACRGTIDAARALGKDSQVAEALRASWADVGVECEANPEVCQVDGRCDIGNGETCASCPDDCDPCSEECGRWKWAKCALGLDDCDRCDLPPSCGDHTCDGDETDASCPQDCGCLALHCEQVAPYGCWCDDGCEMSGDCCADKAMYCPG